MSKLIKVKFDDVRTSQSVENFVETSTFKLTFIYCMKFDEESLEGNRLCFQILL